VSTVAPGTRIGGYEIVGAIGAGGMGQVYRAHDARLNRDVAIKLLPEDVAGDRDRLARFEREAQTLAALNHPNIAQIYGVADLPAEAGSRGLVMEFVAGEDLSRRIARGPLPIDEAVPIARQIADALEAAHDQGIVHRDLKPANVMVRPDGTVKVLDFGLAKAFDPATLSSGQAIANSPTFTAQHTQVGMIIGTAAYMAPEQARGKAVDRRADIWAFGVVLFEMLCGRRAFEGEEISDVLASVLKSEPAWTAIPARVPSSIRRLLRRCLEKDPRRRLSAIGDARFDLDEQEPPAAAVPRARSRLLGSLVVASTAALLTVATAWTWSAGRATPVAPLRRVTLLAPSGVSMYPDSSCVAISPDGTMVAFLIGTPMRTDTELWVRSLDALEAHRLEGATGARLPFWSPDSRTIGYFSDSKMMIVPAAGGRPQVLADVHGAGRGATWNTANVIVFAPDTAGPLYRVSATGGAPVPLTTLDASRNQYGHRFPAFLPDGDHFLYAALPGRNGQFDIFAGSLSGGAPVLIGAMDNAPVYTDGYLLSTHQGVLVAQPFDVKTLKLAGDPVTLGDEPSVILDPTISYTAGRTVSIAANGSLAYYTSASSNTIARWYDATGRAIGTLPLPSGHYDTIRISPDGNQAVAVRSVSPSESTLWLVDTVHGGAVILSNGPGRNDQPVWSPDGSKVLFASDREGPANFYVKTIGSDAPDQLFFRSPALFKSPNAWSPDGKWVVVTQLDPVTAQNIWLLSTDHAREMKPLVIGPRRDGAVGISPDGRWLAFLSDETGRLQLYVMPFPGGGRRVQISPDGATGAGWTPDGRALRFTGLDGRTLWRAEVSSGATFTAAPPSRIAEFPQGLADATQDGRFLVLEPERTGSGTMTVVQNWRAGLPHP
jgi:Tol biopolymer transport system component